MDTTASTDCQPATPTSSPTGSPRPSSLSRLRGRHDHRTRATALWAGIVVPAAFVVTFTLDGALTPGYSAMIEPISFLETGPLGWIQILNFIALGLATIAFAATTATLIRPVLPAGARTAAAGLLALSGAGYLTAAIFPPAAFDQPQTGFAPALHAVGFELVFFGLGLAAVVLGAALIRTPGWRGHGVYSLSTGMILLVFPVINLYTMLAPAGQVVFSHPGHAPSLGGLFNRIVLALAFSWYVALAIRLRTRTAPST